jgi:hypothetical protein
VGLVASTVVPPSNSKPPERSLPQAAAIAANARGTSEIRGIAKRMAAILTLIGCRDKA